MLEAFPPDEWAGVLIEPLCASGEAVCWARRGSPDGPWVELRAEAWDPSPLARDHPISRPGELRIVSEGLLCRYELREQPVKTRQGGRTIIVIEERLVAIERWYEPRIALATENVPRGYSRPRVECWVRDVYMPSLRGRVPSRAEMIAAVKAEWPGAPKREIERLKAKYLPGKPGRPSK